jgi:hypothetical protein
MTARLEVGSNAPERIDERSGAVDTALLGKPSLCLNRI